MVIINNPSFKRDIVILIGVEAQTVAWQGTLSQNTLKLNLEYRTPNPDGYRDQFRSALQTSTFSIQYWIFDIEIHINIFLH